MALTTYPYAPLDLGQNSIRLLRVQKGWVRDDVRCQLFESYPDQERGVAYQALSYTWGGLMHKPGAPNTPRVLIDGHEITMTENLHAALCQIRRNDSDVTLWVDAICINQDDKTEKGHQVSLMGDVYKGADEVLIWLGSSNPDIDALLESISWIDAKVTEAQATGRTDEHWTSLCRRFLGQWTSRHAFDSEEREARALSLLLGRPWFTRIWILQELAFARTARILCGNRSCPARTFALMPAYMRVAGNNHTQAVLDIMPRVRRNTWWASERQLHVLLTKFASSQAFLERDKIYALLGMSEDARDPARFYPCYKKSDDQVYRDTASFLLFGEVLDSSFPLPEFEFSDLSWPIARLAEKALSWIFAQPVSQQDEVREMTELFVDRLNGGHFKTETPVILLFLTKNHASSARLNQVMDIFFHGEIQFYIHFGEEGNTLIIASEYGAGVSSVELYLPHSTG